jgi:glycine/D-amino acid oxidase-like deaminating enzyme
VYFLKNREQMAARAAAREKAQETEALGRIVRASRKPTQPERRGEVKEMVAAAKRTPCRDCGGMFHPDAMDFDHRDADLKAFNISRSHEYSQSRVMEEIAKCDLVCANCHRVRTARRRLGLPTTPPPPDYEI